MKTIAIFLFSIVIFGCSYSQVQVSIASDGTVIGTYDPNTDAITLNSSAVSNHISQKYDGENVQAYHAEKEGGYGYLIVEINYVVNDTTYYKMVAETLAPSTGTSQFPVPTDCEEHTCDGGCRGKVNEYCDCQFEKQDGRIIGCKCSESGMCCHTVKSVSCNNK